MYRTLLCFIIVTVISVTALVVPADCDSIIRISGASTIQPIAEKAAELYRKKYGKAIEVQGGGTSKGIEDAISGISDIGAVSRILNKDETARLSHITIGFDAVAIIVNSRNPLKEIKKETLIALYQGKIVNWKAVAGWDQPVVLVSKQSGRSTLELFEDYSGLRHSSHPVKGDTGHISKSAYEIGSNLESATLTGGIPGAIGYVSVGTALSLIEQGMPIKVVTLDGIAATRENVMNGRYPIRRELNLVFYKKNSAKVKDYFGLFMGREGQKIVDSAGFIPVGTGAKNK